MEKLRPKQEIQTTEHSLTIYVNAPPEIKISPTTEYQARVAHEIVVPIYINDLNKDQTLSLNMDPPNLENATIENRKFYWKRSPTKIR